VNRPGSKTKLIDKLTHRPRHTITFLGVRQPLLTWDEARDKRFRMARRVYDVVQVDAFFDEAEQRLAAMRPTYRGRRD
jgi:DivIVA domain-containing protein